jgi:hypothetical protein
VSKQKLKRSAILLGVAVLFALAGYLLQRVEDSGGESLDVPASELTPVVGSVKPTSTAESPVRSSPVAGWFRDLAADEARGGHTLARHVGKTDDELRARLKAEPDISAASTYFDADTAARVVAEVLSRKSDEVRKWGQRTGSRPNLVLRLDTGEPIGRSIRQGQSNAREVDSAVVVLRWTGSDWYVLTSYPEDR